MADAAAHGVADAYALIERHIREGQRTAQQLNKHDYRLRAGRGDVLEGLLRRSSFLLRLLGEFADSVTQPDSTKAIRRRADDKAVATGDENRSHGNLSVEIDCARPTHVTLVLDHTPQSEKLAIEHLRGTRPGNPPITDVAVAPNRQHRSRVFIVKVPPNQPSDTYAGAIVDAKTGQTRGRLVVRLENLRRV